jgi:hypothetical protein
MAVLFLIVGCCCGLMLCVSWSDRGGHVCENGAVIECSHWCNVAQSRLADGSESMQLFTRTLAYWVVGGADL